MDSSNMGTFLLNLRKEKNLTQKDISNICNVSTQAVSKWERGESVPDIEMLEKLSILYGISINELINGEKQEIYMDVRKRKVIISLTFSVLTFLAYFFNFLQLEYNGLTILLKGFNVIFETTGGFIIVLTWFVFLILVSYLILGIFTVVKVVNQTLLMQNYYLISGIIVALFSIIGLLSGFYILFPQVIILICTVVIVLMNYDEDTVKTSIVRIKRFFQVHVKDKRREQKQLRISRKEKKDISQYIYQTDSFHKRYIAFTVFYSILIAILVLAVVSLGAIIIDDFMRGITIQMIVTELLNFIVFLVPTIYALLSIRYIKTTIVTYKMVNLSIILGFIVVWNFIWIIATDSPAWSMGIMTVIPLLMILGLVSYSRLVIIKTKKA